MPKAKLAKTTGRWSQAIAVGRWLRRRAENVSALLLLAMFLCFILQIVARYVFNRPLGWTDEITVLCWIWCTLWGAAFVLREKDEVRFDIIYSSVSAQTRRVFTIITGIVAGTDHAKAGRVLHSTLQGKERAVNDEDVAGSNGR